MSDNISRYNLNINKTISGWSGYLKKKSEIIEIDINKSQNIFSNNYFLTPRGHGCSFGDQALPNNSVVLQSNNLKSIEWISEDVISVESGVDFREILCFLLPAKKILKAIPGGLQVTVGGAISNNIHGKDHWKNGNFSENIVSITYLDNKGIQKKVTANDEVFQYLIGGMGMFGFIISAELITKNIKSPWIFEKSTKLENKEAFINFFTDLKNNNEIDYAVTWLDFSSKQYLGRGLALTGTFTEGTEVDENYVKTKIKFNNYVFGIFHHKYFWKIAKVFYYRPILNLLNLIKFHFSKKFSQKKIFYSDYMWIDNKLIPEYRKLYSPKGFIEIQPLVNIENGFDNFFKLLEYIKENKLEPLFPSVKLHKKHESPWTFAGNGISICIDIPVARKNFTKTINELYEFLIDIDARVYLAKDSTLAKKFTNKLAPGFKELIEKSNELNFDQKFYSNMVSRLKD